MKNFKDSFITIRLSPWHKKTLQRLSSGHGIGMSEYIRRSIEIEYMEWESTRDMLKRESTSDSSSNDALKDLKVVSDKIFNNE